MEILVRGGQLLSQAGVSHFGPGPRGKLGLAMFVEPHPANVPAPLLAIDYPVRPG